MCEAQNCIVCWWCNGFQLHLMWETQKCVITGGVTALNYICCAKHSIALSLLEQRHSIRFLRSTKLRCHWWINCFQLHFLYETRIAFSLVDKRFSIKPVVRNTELRCHWLSKGFVLFLLCETQYCVVTCVATAFNYTCCAKHRIPLSLLEQRLWIIFDCETQNFVVTGGATAFRYTCAKHRLAFSLVEQRLSIKIVLNTELRCH